MAYREGRGLLDWASLVFLALYAVMASVVVVAGTAIIFFIWICGSVINGVFTLLTRGRRLLLRPSPRTTGT